MILLLCLRLPDLSVDWELASAWTAAVVTFLAVLVALFGSKFWSWRDRPQLGVTFQQSEPFCRDTKLRDGKAAYWVRVKVQNRGIGPARRCVGKLSSVHTNSMLRGDMDPMQLRWCGVPDPWGFEPMEIPRGQHEFLNVLRIVEGEQQMRIETFFDYAPGFATALKANERHRLEISVTADNAQPKTATLTVTYNGDFHRLPNSLTITLGNRMRRS